MDVSTQDISDLETLSGIDPSKPWHGNWAQFQYLQEITRHKPGEMDEIRGLPDFIEIWNNFNPPEMSDMKAVSDFKAERSGPSSNDSEISDDPFVEIPDGHQVLGDIGIPSYPPELLGRRSSSSASSAALIEMPDSDDVLTRSIRPLPANRRSNRLIIIDPFSESLVLPDDRSIPGHSNLPMSPISMADCLANSRASSVALVETPNLDDTFASSARLSLAGSSNISEHQSSSQALSVALIEEPRFRDPFASPDRLPLADMRDDRNLVPLEEHLSPKTIPSSPPPGYSTAVGSSPPLHVPMDRRLLNHDLDEEDTDLEDELAAILATPSPDKSSNKSSRMRTSPYRGRGTPKPHKRKSHSEEDFVPSSSESESRPQRRLRFVSKIRGKAVPPSTPQGSARLRKLSNLHQEDQENVPSSPPISSRTRSRFGDAKKESEDELAFPHRLQLL